MSCSRSCHQRSLVNSKVLRFTKHTIWQQCQRLLTEREENVVVDVLLAYSTLLNQYNLLFVISGLESAQQLRSVKHVDSQDIFSCHSAHKLL